ncbi:MAG: glycerol kinase GlpK [Lachnospiraceae bacterium]|nr:glycerol kinase GlpK [Lachnospiraceae bacterium]
MGKYLMTFDQGTTSSRCIIFDKEGNIISLAQKEFTQIFPKPGWVEHDPMEIWDTQIAVAAKAMQTAGMHGSDIAAIGITNQRETTIVWDKKTGEPVCNAIVWQCRRTSEMVDRLVKDGFGDVIREKTGLIPDAYFSGTKIRWILDNVPGARERAEAGDLLFGTVDTWLIWKLTGGAVHATDRTNASRTMLYDIHRLCWDEEILAKLNIPASMLPAVHPSSHVFGYTKGCRIEDGIPIAGVAGDQQSALFGQCCFEPGEVKNTYGTGCFLLMNTGKDAVRSGNGLLTTIAASPDAEVRYALEGSVFVAGAVIKWLRDELGLIRTAAESEDCCRRVPDTNGVYVVPAFTGLGAPYWDQYARGSILGLTRGAGRDHIVRAAVESLAYQAADLIKAMEADAGVALAALKVDGGAAANNFLMEFQADILNAHVIRPTCLETTALGAAYLAGLAVGFYKDTEEIKSNWACGREFVPEMSAEKRQELYAGWKKAVKRAMRWESE